MEGKPVAEQDIGRQLLQETAAYAETSVCRRRVLLHYFGEEYDQENCHNCDNCLHPKSKVEAMDDLKMALEVVAAVKDNFKVNHIIDVITGNPTEEVIAHKHDDLPCFGSGDDKDARFWNTVIRQAILSGYLYKEVENYGLLKLTPEGRQFISKPVSFLISEDNDFDSDYVDPDAGTSALDEELFKMLKDLRKDVAKQKEIPPYVIFQDSSLEAMATFYPVTIDELKTIPGVGEGKAKRYGKAFCELIMRHCEQNEIDRPEMFSVRTVANKSKNKVRIIQSIDRKVELDILAQSMGLDFDEFLDELDVIVDSGTKLDISYYLKSIMDADQIEDIFEYFRESESDDIDDALDELEDEYTEEQIRLVRIQFISELGN
jgi:ATP-dependent DNA helicase RecQ